MRVTATATVLIVDDYAPSLVALEMALETIETGRPRLVAARSGIEALRIVEEQDLDLILTDQRMQGMSGTELVSRVRSGVRNRDVPIVLLSGVDADDADVLQAASAAGVHFLQKPYAAQVLRARIEQLLASR